MPRVRKKKRGSGGVKLTKGDMREMSLWMSNDQRLYNQADAFALNYAKKKVAGKYNRTLAIKGLANNLVPNILKKMGHTGRTSDAQKKKAGQYLLSVISEMRDDIIKYETHRLPKKYQKKPKKLKR